MRTTLAMENILVRMSPECLKGYTKPTFLKAVKSYKDRQVCMSAVGYTCNKVNPCKPCRSLMAIICRRYHRPELSAADEIAMRLAYEVLFNIVPFKAVEDGSWTAARHRDAGHTTRMRILRSRASARDMSAYPWIH
jgi:hypothetical protein